jgi:molybdate-binding protein/DNA-binding XRE family transcriptional regulator
MTAHVGEVAGDSGASAATAGRRLRLARQARGYSQQQLAGMAGVSRQAVSAVESGHSDPSLRAALALAQALGMTVEELFGPGEPAPSLQAIPVAPPGAPGSRAVLAAVGESFTALPLAGDSATRAGFLPAGGIIAGRPDPGGPGQTSQAGGAGAAGEPGVAVRPIGPPGPALVVAGCDPALPLLEAPLGLLDPPVGFAWWPCGSAEALSLASRGLVHVAGVHPSGTGEEADAEGSAPARAPVSLAGAEVVGFSSWREGLVLRADLAGSVSGLADIARRRLRLVNREAGSEARRLLDRERRSLGLAPGDLPGYETCAKGHLQVASAVAAGLADAGVASEPAALAYGLAFVPLADERFDLVIPRSQRGTREVQGLLRVLASPWLLSQLAGLPGYDQSQCGERVASLTERAAGSRPLTTFVEWQTNWGTCYQ